MKLRGGTAELTIETGRWFGLSRDEGICINSNAGEVEDVGSLLLACTYMVEEKRQMEKLMDELWMNDMRWRIWRR